MKFSDEQLSGFLDGELAPHEMELIRIALAEDDSLPDRMAELAEVDNVIRQTYGAIDGRPLPEAVTRLLAADPRPVNDIGRFGLGRFNTTGSQTAALAATILLALGITLGLYFTGAPDQTDWQSVAAVLEHNPSGGAVSLEGGGSVTARLTFRDRSGSYCRVFEVTNSDQRQQSLACRNGGKWQLAATVYSDAVNDELYAPASGDSPLNDMIDNRIAQGPFDREQESRLIGAGWKPAEDY